MAKKTEDTSNFNFNINSKSKSSGFSETADQFTRLSEAMERAATAASAFVTGVEEINKAPDISKKLKEFSKNAQKYDIPETYINNASKISRTSLNNANSEKRYAEAMLKEQEALVLEYKRERGLLKKQQLADIALEKSKTELAKQQAALKKEQARLEKLFGEQVKQASIDNQNARTRQANARASSIEAQINSGFWDARTATEKAREQYYLNNTYTRNSFNTFSAGYISHNMPFQNVPIVGNLVRSYGYSLGEQVRRGNISKTGVFALDAVVGITQLSDSLIQLGKAAVKSYMEIEKLQTSLEVAYGSKADAQRMFGEITEYAIRSPYTISGTTGIATRLKQSGIADKDLMETIKELGDLAGGNEEKLSRIATNYTQIVADGRAMTRDLREFANAGIPIYQELSQIMGKSVKEIRELAKQGELTSDYIEEALKHLTSEGGAFYKAVEKGAETLQGRITNMQDTVKLAGSEFGERIASIGYESGTSLLDKVIQSVSNTANSVREYFNSRNVEKDLYLANFDKSIKWDEVFNLPIDSSWAESIKQNIEKIEYNTKKESTSIGESVTLGEAFDTLLTSEQMEFIKAFLDSKGYSVGINSEDRRSAGYNAYDLYLSYKETDEILNNVSEIIGTLSALELGAVGTEAYSQIQNIEDILRLEGAKITKPISDYEKYNTEANRRLYSQQTGINTAKTAFDILSDNSKYKSSMESLTTSMEELYKATDEYKKAQEKSKYATLDEAQSKLDELEMIKYYQGQGLNPYSYIMNLYDQGNISGAENAFKTFFTSTGTQFDVSPEGMANLSNAIALSNNIVNTYRDIEDYLPYLKNRNDVGFDAPIQSILSALNSAAIRQDAELISNLIGDAQLAINGDALTETGKSIYQNILNALITSFEIDSEDFENNISAIQRQRLQEVANNVLNTVVNQITTLQNSGFNVSDIINSLPSVRSKTTQQDQRDNIERLKRYKEVVIDSGDVKSLDELIMYLYGRGRDVTGAYYNKDLQTGYSASRTSEIFGYTLGTGKWKIGNTVSPIDSVDAEKLSQIFSMFAKYLNGNEFITLNPNQSQSLTDETLSAERTVAESISNYLKIYSQANGSNLISASIDGSLQKNIDTIMNQIETLIDGLKTDLGLGDVDGTEQELIKNLRNLLTSAIHGVDIQFVTDDMIKELEETYDSSLTPLWKRIASNTLGIPVEMISTEQSIGNIYKEVNDRKNIASLTSYLLGTYNANDVMSLYSMNGGNVLRDKSGRFIGTNLNTEETLNNLSNYSKDAQLYSIIYSNLENTKNQYISFLSQAQTAFEEMSTLNSEEYYNVMGKQFGGEIADWLRTAYNDQLSEEDIMDEIKVRLEQVKLEEKYIDTLKNLISTTEQLNNETEKSIFTYQYRSDGSIQGDVNYQFASSAYDIIKANSAFSDISAEKLASIIEGDLFEKISTLYNYGIDSGLSREESLEKAKELVDALDSLKEAVENNTLQQNREKADSFAEGLINPYGENSKWYNAFGIKNAEQRLLEQSEFKDMNSLERSFSDESIEKIRKKLQDNISFKAIFGKYEKDIESMGIGELVIDAFRFDEIKTQFAELGIQIKETFDEKIMSGYLDTMKTLGQYMGDISGSANEIKELWKGIGEQMLDSIAAAVTQVGLNIAASSALEHSWGGVAAGLAIAATGGLVSFASGMFSSAKENEDDDEADRLESLADKLAKLLEQAKTDADYYEEQYRHKKALSVNSILTESVNDAVIAPNGKIITTDPNDFLIATKTPQNLGGGMPVVNINFVNQSGTEVDIGSTEQSIDEFGNIDITAFIVSKTSKAIADGSLDSAFNAREKRISGKSVAW